MKSKAVLAAAGAAIVGLVMLFLYMDRFEAEASGGDAVQVLIASQDIPLGISLSPAMVAVHEIPQAYVEDRHVLAVDHDRVMGVRVVSTVRAGESLLWTDLATSSDTSRDLSGLVRAGMRAITIEADATASFGGLVRAGDRVDVLITLDRRITGRSTPDGSVERVTVPLLQNLLVLAAGTNMGAPVRSTTSPTGTAQIAQVTLSATVEQAQLLAFASQRGRLTLIMRNPEDIAVLDGLVETTTADIVEEERRNEIVRRTPRAPATPPPTGPAVPHNLTP
jgi:pilus assembly protein CpaB